MRHHLGGLCGVIEIKRILLTLLFACLPSLAFAALYTIDPHQSGLEFTWSYGGLIDDSAKAHAMHGRVHLNHVRPELSDIHVTIQVADIKTGDASTDALLYGESFFDRARFPTITFISNNDVELDDNEPSPHQLSGLLTMHGVTKPVTLDVTLLDADRDALHAGHPASLTLTAQTKLDRTQFNMTDYAGIIGQTISISITAHLKKSYAAASPAPKPRK